MKKMSKELEALKHIISEISNYKLHGIGDENWLGFQDILSDVKLIEQTLEELEAIKSADGGEAMEYLDKMFYADNDYGDGVGLSTAYGGKTEQMIFMENFILKSQAQERELRELKEKVRNLAGNHILSKTEEVFGENNSLVNKIDELLNLCKGSEE